MSNYIYLKDIKGDIVSVIRKESIDYVNIDDDYKGGVVYIKGAGIRYGIEIIRYIIGKLAEE